MTWFDLVYCIIFFLQVFFGLSLIVLSVFCIPGAVKASSRSGRALNIVLSGASMLFGISIELYTWITFFTSYNRADYSTLLYGLLNLNRLTYRLVMMVLLFALILLTSAALAVFGIIAAKRAKKTEQKYTGHMVAGVVTGFILALFSFSSLVLSVSFMVKNQIFSAPSYQYDKPVIYLYPEENTVVHVSLGEPEKITVSYPEYTLSGWEFTARPDGMLTADGREYPYMYYEFDSAAKFGEEGFVVAGTDTAAFLEDKLGAMGFTYREQAEFITYWLPKLAVNDYNRIEFISGEEIDAIMPLTITPEPDNILRVYMLFAPCDPEISKTLPEQELPVLIREGFTVLEWGGSEIC